MELPLDRAALPAAPEAAPPAASPALGATAAPARVARVALLAAADLAALLVAASLAYALWALPVRAQLPGLYVRLLPFLPLFALGYAQAGLYPGFGLGPVERLRRFTLTTLFVFLVLASFGFALKLPHLYSRVTFGLALAASLVLVPPVRSLALALAARREWFREPVVLIGTAGAAERLARHVAAAPASLYQPVARLGPPPPAGETETLRWLGQLTGEAAGARHASLQVAIVCPEQELPSSLLDRLQEDFRHVVVAREGERLPVEGLQVRVLGDAVGIEYTNNLLRRRNRVVKRLMDVVLGSLALAAALPLMAAAILAVRLFSRGPALFHQRREGYGGVHFRMPKIRTMHADAERRLEEHLSRRPDLDREWREHLKLQEDPRLVRGVGKLLRRLSVDELPQLWSVVRGEMSLVGPRPFPDYHVARFSPEFRRLRQRVRPGITGLWQVLVRSEGGLEAQERLDSHYIRNWSIWLDVYLLARTVGAVLAGRGAY